MSRQSVPFPRALVVIPVLVLLLAPLPALAATERESGQATVWGAELFGSIYERVAGWFHSLAGVVKLGPEMDPNGAPASEGPQEGGVTELGPDMDPNG